MDLSTSTSIIEARAPGTPDTSIRKPPSWYRRFKKYCKSQQREAAALLMADAVRFLFQNRIK
ncbi:hypothetical protein C2S51_019451 [Perilla frutescens var. frutescens]|nr:hypothetical protein C2S51_019451 [Perilla frutescens var. frutescens]